MFMLVCLLLGASEIQRFPLEGEDFAVMPQTGTLQVDAAGLIYVADWPESLIRVFDETGTQLRTIGRKGEGPGEFRRWFGIFSVADGKLYQHDYFGGNRFINVFNLEGKLLRTINTTDLPTATGVTLLLPHKDQFFIAYDHAYQGTKNGPLYFLGPMQTFSEMSNEGKLGKPRFEERATYEISKFPNREGRQLPGQNGMMVAVSPDLGVVVKQRTNGMEGVLVDLKTGREVTFKNGFSRRPVLREMVDALQKERAMWVNAEFRPYEAELYGILAKNLDQYDLYAGIVDHLFFTDKTLVLVGVKNKQGQHPIHTLDPKTGAILKQTQRDYIPFHQTATKTYGLAEDEEEETFHIVIESH